MREEAGRAEREARNNKDQHNEEEATTPSKREGQVEQWGLRKGPTLMRLV
jgi:hypothetical protein